jgi:hypothetical protein
MMIARFTRYRHGGGTNIATRITYEISVRRVTHGTIVFRELGGNG